MTFTYMKSNFDRDDLGKSACLAAIFGGEERDFVGKTCFTFDWKGFQS